MSRFTGFSEEFIQQYPHFPAHMTQLAKFVYYRTYSRWLTKEGRRETWRETVVRALTYNCQMAAENQEDAEALFDNVFNLRQFISGRSLWIGGSSASESLITANFNCAFTVMDNVRAFVDLFYLLMVGTGVGFRILKDDVAKLPKFRHDVILENLPFEPLPSNERVDPTSIIFRTDDIATIVVGDSKEGWVQALQFYLDIHTRHDYRKIKRVRINYNGVRPKGERLVTFGGTASGYESLATMFEKIHKVLTTEEFAPAPVEGQLRPIHVLDICNIIGENVVVGGVRRTAETAIISPDDDEVIEAKTDLTPNKFHRFMSNNSIYFTEKPSRERLQQIFHTLRYTGEPGFVNAAEGKRRRADFEGLNPCFEILLPRNSVCNLTTVNILAFVKDGKLLKEELLAAERLSARACYRMTCMNLELHNWNQTHQRDRLLGCSMTGWQDAMSALGYDREQQIELMRELHDAVRAAADEYADELGTPRSLLVTAVKPEGTLSLVAGGVSPGLHYSHSEYFIRRIRVNASDPLAKTAEALGWSVHPEVGQEEPNVRTKVIDFPCYSPVKRTKYDVSAMEQLQTYYDFQKHYTEQNSSNTISIKDDEWDDVCQNVYDHWDEMLACSFLSLSDHHYELAPYEAITKEEYEAMTATMQDFNPNLLNYYEQATGNEGKEFEILDDREECASGVCPIK